MCAGGTNDAAVKPNGSFAHEVPDVRALPFLLRCLARPFGTANPNALYALWYNFLTNLSNGLVFAGVIAIYLQEITGSNAKVGYAEGVFGFMGLIPGLVGGYVSDRRRRDTVLRWSGYGSFMGIAILLALCITYLASAGVDRQLEVNIPHFGSWKFLVVCVAVSIIYGGESIGDAASQAILADSLTTGNRQGFMTKMSVVMNIAYGVGPLFCAGIELLCDNKWNETNLTVLVICGIAVRLPCAMLCFCFNDDCCLMGESLSITEAAEVPTTAAQRRGYARIPYLYFASDVLWCFGSGMTVKFFPIFFKNDPSAGEEGLGLTPTVLFLISAGGVLLCAPTSGVGLSLSRWFGRIQTDILLWYMGIGCLAGMCAMGYAGHFTARLSDRAIVLGLYLLRTATLQSTDPIQKSVIMDFVPKSQRARWASVQAITTAGWCGSAAVGGWLVDAYSYNFAFLVTCVFHVLSTFVKMPMLCIVPIEQKTLAEYAEVGDAEAPTGDTAEAKLQRPPSERDALLVRDE